MKKSNRTWVSNSRAFAKTTPLQKPPTPLQRLIFAQVQKFENTDDGETFIQGLAAIKRELLAEYAKISVMQEEMEKFLAEKEGKKMPEAKKDTPVETPLWLLAKGLEEAARVMDSGDNNQGAALTKQHLEQFARAVKGEHSQQG